MPIEERKGFTCACGKRHEYPLYVHAHWDEPLGFTCEDCKAQYDIRRGIAMPRRKARKVGTK